MTGNERIIEMCWKDEIISIISKKTGHEMSLFDIYNEIKKTQLVTDYHLKPWKPSGQPRYQCWTRKYLSTLVKQRRIKRLRRGVYTL